MKNNSYVLFLIVIVIHLFIHNDVQATETLERDNALLTPARLSEKTSRQDRQAGTAVLTPYHYQESLINLPEEPGYSMLNLSLKESVMIALEKNFEIIIEKFTSKISETGIQNQKGTFDPILSAAVSTSHDRTEDAVGEINDTDLNKFSAEISKKFKPGLKLSLLYETSDRDEISNEGRYNSSLKLQATQSLLKNFGIEINNARIRIAGAEYKQSREELALRTIEVAAQVQSAYWDYYKNQKDLEVRRKSYDLTKNLFKKKKQEAELGSLVPADLIEIESRVASKVTEYFEAKKAFRESDVVLRKLLGLAFNFEGHPVTIQAEKCPVYSPQQINFKESFKKALQTHPEYRKKQLQVEAKELEVKLMNNQTLPDLEAFASYGFASNKNSWSGNDGAYALKGGDNYEVGLKLSIPLGNNEAESNYLRAWLELSKLKAELERQELEIKKSISNAKIALEQNALLYQAGKNNLALKEKNLKAGEQKLKYGTITLRELLDIQTELINAKLQLIGSEVNYEKSLIELYKVQGLLDPRLNISLSDL